MAENYKPDSPEEKEAYNSGMEKFKNALEKNKTIKKTFFLMKTVVLPMLLFLLKILLVTILALAVIVLFTSGKKKDGTSGEEEGNMTSGVQVGNTDVTAEDWMCTEQEIIEFINEYATDNDDLKEKLLNRVIEIKEWQENHGYSATLLITIAFEEDKKTDELDYFLDKMNDKAANWKEKGYKTVQDIAKDYVGDESAQEWANRIEKGMSETGVETGIIETGEIKTAGDGYDSIFISRTGKRYRNYKQIMGSYANHVWIKYTNSEGKLVTSTIYYDGCCLTSIAIIASGYNNADINPKDIVMKITNGTGYMSSFIPGNAMSACGVSYTRPYYHKYTELSEVQKHDVINHLNSGKPVIIYVLGANGIRDGNGNLLGRGNSAFTSSQHWMALLEYNSSTNQIYVSNPSSTNPSKTGWIDADYVLQSCTEYIAITN